MKRKELHSGTSEGLVPLEKLDLSQVNSFEELVRAMGKTAFGGRSLGEAFDIWLTMAHDPDCKVVLTLSGAMTVGQQGRIICEMIDRGLVQVVVSTGALICHGLSHSLGGIHYRSDPTSNDKELFEKGFNRVFDTLEEELSLNDVEHLVEDLLTQHDGIWCSERFCRLLGRLLNESDSGPGILRSAWLKNVPVFIPAFTDSELALDLYVWAMKQMGSDPGKEDLLEALDKDKECS
jgi:deoxyhypusine synthase